MQSKTADFAPVPSHGDLEQATLFDVRLVAPPGELNDTYNASSWWPILYYENVTSPTKKPTEAEALPRPPQIIRTENLLKFGRLVFEISERTNRQINTHTVEPA